MRDDKHSFSRLVPRLSPLTPYLQALATWLGLSVIFGVAYTQAPLYYSNQNQYFLHGLAQAGWGDLKHDWLANTRDPTPLFSALVAFTVFSFPQWLFHLYYLLLLGLYCYSLFDLGLAVTPHLTGRPARLGFLALLVLFHAGIVRWLSMQLFRIDYPWYFQAGLAGQYVLGFGLQPSVSGVFLIASLSSFMRNHRWRAVLWACLAPMVHATYFLSAGLVVLGYMFVRHRTPASPAVRPAQGEQPTMPAPGAALFDKQRFGGVKGAILLGGFALLLVLPSLIYNVLTFAPTSPSIFHEAQHILRIFASLIMPKSLVGSTSSPRRKFSG